MLCASAAPFAAMPEVLSERSQRVLTEWRTERAYFPLQEVSVWWLFRTLHHACTRTS
jgi:hypothetical protein